MAIIVLPQGPGNLVVVTRRAGAGTGPGAWRGTIHAPGCPSAKTGAPLTGLIERHGEQTIRTKIRVGVLAACGRCHPTLITLVEGD